ncbi:binding-protein-dependent transport systems inner membrane component [Methanosalsum zhilinae DSM 4017]|uniref:Binding-protein-dependent transport systems inner membrane component n=1 Tax=Methanosalsum zhilinae (strain DSM 4017 / NBRC 107636 / OCM 62 / WeN5) TaxID=679901 RepID=F7XQL7_METZD|nr:ABC transporter permease [Methanosalsum zhilinae]AEH61616.1 binding-protein-dependent transport systems inner membrane component [Methanosalsum zhilinae DSM 4017]
MENILSGAGEALNLLASMDPYVMGIIAVSLQVSGTALIIAALIGIPLGAFMGLTNFPGKPLIVALLYTGMGFPPVVIGLFVFILLSSSGSLGSFGWLFTPYAMIMAQSIISFPLVAGFTMTAVMGVDRNLIRQLRSLGATKTQATIATLREARLGVLVSIIAGFGAIISEVGAVMLVGGNIEGATRVLTTAIVLETRKGNFGVAIAFGIILLTIAFIVNFAMLRLQNKELRGNG